MDSLASLEGLGDVANRQGNSTEARRCFQESLSIGEEINQPRVIAWSLVGLAEADQAEGDLMQARERYQQSLNLCREHGIQDGIPIALIRLGRVACSLGEIAEAKKHFAEALAFEQGRGYTSAILEVLAGMAALLAMAGETAEALRLSLFILKQPMCWYETQCAVARLHNTLCATFPAQAATLAHDERPLTAVCERALVWLEQNMTAAGYCICASSWRTISVISSTVSRRISSPHSTEACRRGSAPSTHGVIGQWIAAKGILVHNGPVFVAQRLIQRRQRAQVHALRLERHHDCGLGGISMADAKLKMAVDGKGHSEQHAGSAGRAKLHRKALQRSDMILGAMAVDDDDELVAEAYHAVQGLAHQEAHVLFAIVETGQDIGGKVHADHIVVRGKSDVLDDLRRTLPLSADKERGQHNATHVCGHTPGHCLGVERIGAER